MNTGNEGHWYDGLLTGVTGGAVLAFLVALLKFAERALPWLVRCKTELDVVNGITDTHPIYREMEMAIEQDGAMRVLMLAAHNGGSIPSPTTPFYTSAIHAAADSLEHRKRASAYQNIRVDAAYIEMLLEMHRRGFYRFDMTQNQGTMLREFYEAEGITDSLLVYLGVYGKQFVYMSFARFEGVFALEEITRLRIRANGIAQMINRG